MYCVMMSNNLLLGVLFIYSQTECSFDENLANFRCNIGILIDSLSGASCNLREQVASFVFMSKLRIAYVNRNYTTSVKKKKRQNCLVVKLCKTDTNCKSCGIVVISGFICEQVN